MDEPLGALDKNLREQMQYEIKQLHDKLGFTVIYITHDQSEALTMSDRIVVFNEGVAQQIDEPMKLYEKPMNSFVANFMGENNQIIGKVLSEDDEDDIINVQTEFGEVRAFNVSDYKKDDDVMLSIRPEKIILNPKKDDELRNIFDATIKDLLYMGDHIRLFIKMKNCKQEIIVRHSVALDSTIYKKQDKIHIGWHRKDCRVLNPL